MERGMIESLNRRPFRTMLCGCVFRRHNAGDGWVLYDVSPCPADARFPRRFWSAPCGCLAFSDGVRLVCGAHAFLAVVMPMGSE
jgi:hypothetical protein